MRRRTKATPTLGLLSQGHDGTCLFEKSFRIISLSTEQKEREEWGWVLARKVPGGPQARVQGAGPYRDHSRFPSGPSSDASSPGCVRAAP